MQVETYEIEEIKSSDASTMAADSEAIELSKTLGLVGQIKLTDTKTDTRCQYRKMTALEHLVFKTLFPQNVDVADYSSGIIPLRVLQVLSHAKEIGMFTRFEVWGPEDYREPDPVLVAHTKGLYQVGNEVFLLARWGDCLAAFEALAEKAKAAWIATHRAKASEAIIEAQKVADRVEIEADVAFRTGKVETHTIYL